MPFSSFNFIMILPFMVLSFWLLPPRFQKVWLVVLSAGVYLAAGWVDLALLVGIVSLNWAGPRLLGPGRRVTSALILGDVAFLGFFKYRLFLGHLAGLPAAPGLPALVIPLGISFYVFQLIAYQVEVRRGQVGPRPPWMDFLLYIFFFPHHQAGPIMRPHAFLGCFSRPRTFFRSRMTTGLMIFLWGLFKKVWIADVAAPLVNVLFHEFHLMEGAGGNLPLMGVLFGIQVYGDFSGYSDMAVGLGRMFGYKFDRNFHQPFLAGNPTDFWNRWHVTLTRWMRDFVYFPLWNGSARILAGRLRPVTLMLGCSLAVMLLTGLWHGAGWNFVVWGGFHGLLFLAWRPFRHLGRWWAVGLKYLLFQGAVVLSWLFFREQNVGTVLRAMARGGAWTGPETRIALALFAAMALFSCVEHLLEHRFIAMTKRAGRAPAAAFAMVYGCLLFIVLIGAGSATKFIYQRF